MTVRVAIAGAGGRMGQALIEATLFDTGLTLAAALEIDGSSALGRDAGERFGRRTGVVVGSDVETALRGADVLVDFTRPCAKRRGIQNASRELRSAAAQRS